MPTDATPTKRRAGVSSTACNPCEWTHDTALAFVALSKVSVHYTERGEGVPLVLLHANPGDSQDFDAVIPSLAKCYRVVALDWPAYGQSEIPPDPTRWTLRDFQDVLCEFLDTLGLPPSIFVGNSVGGYVAARLAIESAHRVRGLILVSPGGFTPHNFITRAFCRFQGSRFSLSPHRFARLYLRHRTPATLAMLQRAATLQSERERVALNRAIWRSFADPQNDLRPHASQICVPTLMIFGQHDPAIPAGRDGLVAARCMPLADFFTIPCGHAPFAEMPERFLELIRPLLERCEQR